MTREEFLRDYWRYYLLLEEKFKQTINYVEVSERNFPAYSIEYAYLLQSIGGELDTFFKVYCGLPLNSYKKLEDYSKVIKQKYSEIINQEIVFSYAGIRLKPFKNLFSRRRILNWWKAYNDIKHNRSQSMHCASQKNVLNALSALNILEMKYLSEIVNATDDPDCPDQPSDIFELVNWNTRDMPFGNTGYYFSVEDIPD